MCFINTTVLGTVVFAHLHPHEEESFKDTLKDWDTISTMGWPKNSFRSSIFNYYILQQQESLQLQMILAHTSLYSFEYLSTSHYVMN